MPAPRLSEVSHRPDLTPLLDVVFQLMTFFIMVSNFTQDIFDQSIRLPVAGSAQPIRDAAQDRLVLNVDERGRLLFNNRALGTDEAIKQIEFQASLARLNAEVAGITVSAGDSLPTTVIFRADRRTEFSDVFRLISACQASGFTKFDLRALSSPGS